MPFTFILLLLFSMMQHSLFLLLLFYRKIRQEDRASSPLHIFSTHFYTTLSNDGTEAVKSWTARKNVDIFKKRYIFLPINKSSHWLLCLVANPAYVSNVSGDNDTQRFDCGTGPFPCILLLDSSKVHPKDIVAGHVRKWLNGEWMRLMAPKHGGVDPFNTSTMAVFTPKSKFLSMPLFLCCCCNEYCRSHVSSTLSGQQLRLWSICLPQRLCTLYVTSQPVERC